MKYDIAEILEVKEAKPFLAIMQEDFERRIGRERFFRITGTPVKLDGVSADLDDPHLIQLLTQPPNPNGRLHGWDVKPLPPLKRNSLGFENERTNFHHMKFVRNGHLEFWNAIDEYFCWQQDPEQRKMHPRLYPYAVVEHPLSFVRLFSALAGYLNIECGVIFQMQYLNVEGAVLLPYQPESIGFNFPMDPVRPLERNRLVFPAKTFDNVTAPDPIALELIKDLYYEFGYGREHIPFFDETGNSSL